MTGGRLHPKMFKQGSILGPLLFILYMNDITCVCTLSNISLYADDTAIYACGLNIEVIQYKLQHDLDNIQNWLLHNKLTLNVSKCKVLKVSTPQHRTRGLPLNISIAGTMLEEVTSYKYLGFWLDPTMSFHSHIDHLISKANKRIGLIKQSRKFLGEKCSLILYKSLVLPVIDYGDLLYRKSSAYKLNALQILQKKFC